MLEVSEVFLVILVALTATISKTLFLYFNRCSISSKFLLNEHVFTVNDRLSAPAQLAAPARISAPLKLFFSNKHPARLATPARISTPPLRVEGGAYFVNK